VSQYEISVNKSIRLWFSDLQGEFIKKECMKNINFRQREILINDVLEFYWCFLRKIFFKY